MNPEFITDNFLLHSHLAQEIYAEIEKLPIIDYHSHLCAKEIYEDYNYQTITEMWLKADHYKWRQMRTLGIAEQLITSPKDEFEQFKVYAKTLDYAIGNPLYHWSHLELKRFFNINQVLTEKNATEIYEQANAKLALGNLSVRKLLKMANVKMVGTTDDICDDLIYHQKIANDQTIDVQVLPTFRPDKYVIYHADYVQSLRKLSGTVGKPIDNFEQFLSALNERLDFFAAHGCVISDHGISKFKYEVTSYEQGAMIFAKILNNNQLTEAQAMQFNSFLLDYLTREYEKRNWVLQLHLGATRNNNQFLAQQLGTDIGCDAISGLNYIDDLTTYLTNNSCNNNLPKIIIYNLNPRDNEALMAMIGSFQGASKGHLQLGSAWWFNDHIRGIENHLEAYQSLGLLRVFIGMLTDSRSFLSFVRHEYFRRILANHLANLVINGLYPNDKQMLKQIAVEISYENAKNYFDLEGK